MPLDGRLIHLGCVSRKHRLSLAKYHIPVLPQPNGFFGIELLIQFVCSRLCLSSLYSDVIADHVAVDEILLVLLRNLALKASPLSQ